jgi:hypothetical protein
LTACRLAYLVEPNDHRAGFDVHPPGDNATGWIARFLRRMAVLRLLGME